MAGMGKSVVAKSGRARGDLPGTDGGGHARLAGPAPETDLVSMGAV